MRKNNVKKLVGPLIGTAILTASPGISHAVFAQVLEGGCYIEQHRVCKLHVEPFTINVNETIDERVRQFQLRLNGVVVYEMSTDDVYSRRPAGDFSPTLGTQDIAIECNTMYSLDIIVHSSTPGADNSPVLAGRAEPFSCPHPWATKQARNAASIFFPATATATARTNADGDNESVPDSAKLVEYEEALSDASDGVDSDQ